LKLYDVEVSAYRVLMEGLKATGPDIPWEKMLKNIRNRKRFRQHFKKKYDVTLETFLQQIDAEVSGQEARLFLREWKPKGPSN
jgi:hypothetical protein